MTLNQLSCFRELAKTRHMGRAAEGLYIAQSSLSSSIARLEAELGVLLFERRGHHMLLTAEGEALLAHAETVLREVEETGEPCARELYLTTLRREEPWGGGCQADPLFHPGGELKYASLTATPLRRILCRIPRL